MADPPKPSLWKELKERKVVKVAAVYGAVAWGVVMGGSELSQILELPAWVPKLVLILAVLGFPVALVLAWAFEITPGGVRRAEPLQSAVGGRASRMPFFAGIAVGVSAITFLAFMIDENGAPPSVDSSEVAGLDTDLVAVLPFLYSGPEDLSYLGEGVSQMLASRFTGEIGPRATDPTATAAVWHDASKTDPTTATRMVAERLGAGLVLTGGVVAGPDGLNLTATLRSARTDEDLASASARGAPEELAVVVERLAGGILSLSVGDYAESLEQLTSADPDALREYLLGQAEFRAGRRVTAYDHFVRAVEVDSSFALAAIWAADAANNIPGAASGRYLQLASLHQDRLSARDRVYLGARLGSPDPETREQRRRAWEQAARALPERANAWYWLGETTMHFPRSSEDIDRALGYFQRAIELDPTNINVLLHLSLTYHVRRDLPGAHEVSERWAALDTSRVVQLDSRLMRAISNRDSSVAVALYDSLEALGSREAGFTVGVPFDAPALLVAEWQIGPILENLEATHARLTPSDPFATTTYLLLYYSYQDLGLPARAEGILTALERARGVRYDRDRILNALYGELPEGVGRGAVDRRQADLDVLPDDEWNRTWIDDLTAIQMWRIEHDDPGGVSDATRRIRSVGAAEPEAYAKAAEGAALLLEAMVQARRGEPRARDTIEAFEALFLQGLSYPVTLYDAMVLATADVYERLADPETALRALERESNFNLFHWPYTARFARERGRLAALTADTTRAIREYEFYTTLRSRADVSLQADVAAVRAELEALRGG